MGDKKEITQIRMSENLKQRIRQYQAQITKLSPLGVEISFSEATRALIEKGLEK